MTIDISRPGSGEHAPFASTYVEATARACDTRGIGIMRLLEGQPAEWIDTLAPFDPGVVTFAYAPEKWTLGESMLHVIDTERVFAYRMLRFARGDQTPLPGFDQDAWVPESRSKGRELASLLAELSAVRAATMTLVHSLDETAWQQVGTANGHPLSTRALAWMIAGHAEHHLELVKTRYLPDQPRR